VNTRANRDNHFSQKVKARSTKTTTEK